MQDLLAGNKRAQGSYLAVASIAQAFPQLQAEVCHSLKHSIKQHSGASTRLPGTVWKAAPRTLPLAGAERPLWILPFWSWWQLPDYDKREKTGVNFAEVCGSLRETDWKSSGSIGGTLPRSPLSQFTGQSGKDNSKSGDEKSWSSSWPNLESRLCR